VQKVVSSYETHLNAVLPAATADTEVHGKEASNLIVLLSELYNFEVISCVLVYDIIRGLLSRPYLTEYNVELLLKITRSMYQ
jgi:nucleolar MIF4G domain-containing protein 1